MSIIDTAKEVYALAQKGLTIELQEELMKLREQALELQEQNLSLRNCSYLRCGSNWSKEGLQFDGEVYKGSDGAHCATCHDKDAEIDSFAPEQKSRYAGEVLLQRVQIVLLIVKKRALP